MMKESRHTAVNEAKWDKWADTIDGKGWKYEYLRKAQDSVTALLEMKEDTRLLDIGCGNGWALKLTAGKNNDRGIYYGIDLSEKMIEKARENFEARENFHFLKANSESIPLEDNFFDYIICTNSFHHYLHPEKALQEMFRLLRPGGKTFILDPTADGGMMKMIDKFLKLTDRAHVKTYSTREFEKMMSNAGLVYLENQIVMGPVKIHTGKK